MPTFVRPNRFEFTLGNPLPYEARTVLTASFGVGQSGVGGYVTFSAVHRETISNPDAPAEYQGLLVERQLPARTTFYADDLAGDQSRFAHVIRGICHEEITGRAARDLVWTMFWTLIISDPANEWVDALGDEFLCGLRAEALATA